MSTKPRIRKTEIFSDWARFGSDSDKTCSHLVSLAMKHSEVRSPDLGYHVLPNGYCPCCQPPLSYAGIQAYLYPFALAIRVVPRRAEVRTSRKHRARVAFLDFVILYDSLSCSGYFLRTMLTAQESYAGTDPFEGTRILGDPKAELS
jgi:hypothetical protein